MSNQMSNQPSPEQIAGAAYLIWEKEGWPHGRDIVHWLQAEEQLNANRLHEAGALPRPDVVLLVQPAAGNKPHASRRKKTARTGAMAL